MGQRFGEYELIRHIATGGMAEIFLARQSAGLDRTLVIKRMLPELAVRGDFVQMFLDEAKLTASLQHPHVVRVYDLGQADNAYFIAMELVDGPHLGALFAHSLRAKKPPPVELCAWIAARAADGLHYAHELNDPASGEPLQLVHRDISPQNILVSRHGEVKITDFGVAKANSQQTKTRTGVVKGKVSYMSPEQCLGDSVDRRTDVFALGVVLYELLTRRRLFRDKSDLLVMQRITTEVLAPPSSINPAVEPGLDAIVMKSLARPLEERFQTASELAEALDAWLSTVKRPANEMAMAQWFTDHCPELAPTTTLTAVTEATVSMPFAPPDGPTSATPSFSVRGGRREAERLVGQIADATDRVPAAPAAIGGAEATTITAPPQFDPIDPAAVPRPALVAVSAPSLSLPPTPSLTSSPSSPSSSSSSAAAAPAGEGVMPTVEVLAAETVASPPSRRVPLMAIGGGVAAAVVVAVLAVVMRGAPVETPPPPPVASVLARVLVSTVPSGVPILVGDRVVGQSPVTVDSAPGPVVVQAQFAGQPAQATTVDVGASGDVIVEFLAKVPLVVQSTPPRAKVRLNGELLGETPFERGYLIEPGVVVTLRLEPPPGGFLPHESEIVASPGEPLLVEVDLVAKEGKKAPVDPGKGMLSMRTEPSAQVQIDKVAFAETPFVEKELKAGRHTIAVINKELGLDDRFMVTVPKDKTLVVIVKYDKTAGGWKLRSKTVR